MENYFWSPSELSFYPESIRSVYEASKSWPRDAIEVTGEDWKTYGVGSPPEGMRRGSDDEGRPSWVPLPEATATEISAAIATYRDTKWSSEIVSSTNGVRAKTDALTRQRVNEKLNYLESRGEDTVIRWKGPDGFADSTAADFQEITIKAEAVRQRAFDAEDAITGREFKTIEEARKAFDTAYSEAGE